MGRFLKVATETSKEVFDILSDDVVAVAEWTKRQAGIDTTRIGVLGFSQGGVDSTPGRLQIESYKILDHDFRSHLFPGP